jgi:plastocyanin
MSIMGRRVPGTAVALVALAVLVVALIPVMTQARPDREIHLVARGMAFYLEGEPAVANPTLELAAGERVRIVLRNDEQGMVHDFAVSALSVDTDRLAWRQRGEVTLVVPDRPGSYEYVCSPHRLLMRGVVRIAPHRSPPS